MRNSACSTVMRMRGRSKADSWDAPLSRELTCEHGGLLADGRGGSRKVFGAVPSACGDGLKIGHKGFCAVAFSAQRLLWNSGMATVQTTEKCASSNSARCMTQIEQTHKFGPLWVMHSRVLPLARVKHSSSNSTKNGAKLDAPSASGRRPPGARSPKARRAGVWDLDYEGGSFLMSQIRFRQDLLRGIGK